MSTILLRRAPDLHRDIDAALVLRAKRAADRCLPYTGQMTPANQAIIRACSHFERRTGTRLIFTRDADPHLSGWWKNPDFARNRHLSLSYVDPELRLDRSHDHRLSRLWTQAFFGDDAKLLWCEPPSSSTGKAHDVWHFRLFMELDWRTALKPRGEVYTKRNTPAGWLSWSDLQEHLRDQGQTEPRW